MERTRVCSVEALDDLHSTAAARARWQFGCCCGLCLLIVIGAIRFGGWNIEERSTQHELVGAMAVSKQAVVANAVEPVRQDVEQEAPHELTDRQSHDFASRRTALPVILPAKTDMVVVEIEQSAIGDGDTVGVTGQIGENL